MLDASKVKDIIDYYNRKAPKDTSADPSLLILADNKVTRTIKSHYGNIHVAVVEGSWGAGKTSTALKIFHDLKSEVYVTYAAARDLVGYISGIGLKTKVNGKRSTLATLIALLLTQAKTLAEKFIVLTNAPAISLEVEAELSEVLEKYSRILMEELPKRPGESGEVKRTKTRHIILVDELEQALLEQTDLEAIAVCMLTLRQLFDRGYSALTIAFFVPPIRPGTKLYELTQGAPLFERIKDLIKSIVARTPSGDPEMAIRYVLDKALLTKLDDPATIEEVYKGFVERVNLLMKKLGYTVDLSIDSATLRLLASTGYVRFGSDLLINAIAKAVAEQRRLEDCVADVVREALGLGNADPVKILYEGRFGVVDIDFANLMEVLEKILGKLRDEHKIANFTMLEERRVKGFESMTYLVTYPKGTKRSEVVVTFWFRLSDLTSKGLARANMYFKGRKVVLITTPNAKHKVITSSAFNLVDIVRLPNEILYYIVARNRISDVTLREDLEEKFGEYKHVLEEAVLKALEY